MIKKQFEHKDKMSFTSEGKYIVDGKEILIDDLDEIPKEIADQLEKAPMTQLDALYVRKRIHHISNVFNRLSLSIEDRFNKIDEKIKMQEVNLEKFTAHELECRAEQVPIIASKVVHEIVNGKFGNISEELRDIKTNQTNAASILTDYKEEQSDLYTALMDKLEYVGNKTIFGWIKHSFETKPLRTALIAGLVSVLGFLYVMASLRIKSFSDMFEFIKNWVN